MTRQIHVANGTRVQTLATIECPNGGITILSTLGTDHGLSMTEIHIPAAARPWLTRAAGEPAMQATDEGAGA